MKKTTKCDQVYLVPYDKSRIFGSPQSAVRSPQSAVRSPQSAVRLAACLLFAVFMLSSTALLAQPKLTKSGWNCIFHEDFNASAFRNPNYLSKQMYYGNFQEGVVQRDTNVVFSNRTTSTGIDYDATLKCHRNPTPIPNFQGSGTTCYWNAGWLRTTYEDYVSSGGTYDAPQQPYSYGGYLYGMFEVRCKLPRHFAATSCVWLCGNNAWPPETDAYEHMIYASQSISERMTKIFSSQHFQDPEPPSNPKSCATRFNFPKSLSEDFHTWTIVWTPSEIAWFLDGVQFKRIDQDYVVPGHFHNYTNPTTSAAKAAKFIEVLRYRAQDIVLSNGVYASDIAGSLYYNYYNNTAGVPDFWCAEQENTIPSCPTNQVQNMVIDYIKVYRPAALTVANTAAFTGFSPTLFPTPVASNETNIVNYFTNTLLPTYQNANFRTGQTVPTGTISTEGWTSDYIGWDAQEYIIGSPLTNDYKVIDAPIATIQGEQRAFFVDEQAGQTFRSLKMIWKTGLGNNPNAHSIIELEPGVILKEYEIAANRTPTAGTNPFRYNVYYRKINQLWCATSVTGAGAASDWTVAAVTGASDINGEVQTAYFTVSGTTTEYVVYKNTANKIVELKRTYNATTGVPNAFTKSILAPKVYNELVNAPNDFSSNLLIDPVVPQRYYYKSTATVAKLITLYFSSPNWIYRPTAPTNGVAMMRTTIKGDAAWRKILFTDNTNALRTFDPVSFTTAPVTADGTTAIQALDIATGNKHNSTVIGTSPKNIYYKTANANDIYSMYMLTWDASDNVYLRTPVQTFADNMGIKGLGNMMPNNKDMPIFYHPTDGRIRELNYGTLLYKSSVYYYPLANGQPGYPIPYIDPTTQPCNIEYNGYPVYFSPRPSK